MPLSIFENLRPEYSRGSELEREVLRQLRSVLPGGGAGVIFDTPRLPSNVSMPKDPRDIRFDFRLPRRGIGTVVFSGVISSDGKPQKRLSGAVLMDREATGVQVRRLIRRGERLTADNLEMLDARLSQLPPGAFATEKDLIGTSAKSEIRPGMWLTGRMLRLPSVVKNRQPVTMKLVRAGIHITCTGIAKQNGALGDVIRVMNLQSKREVLGRIVSKDVVEILN